MSAPTAFGTRNEHQQRTAAAGSTLICFSHLRWDFVFQRPQHLMARFARENRVLFWQEPRFSDDLPAARLDVAPCAVTGVVVLTPVLPSGMAGSTADAAIGDLLTAFLAGETGPFVRWYYTPMMLPFSRAVRRIVRRLRLHGRAVRTSRARRRSLLDWNAAARRGRPGLHRRLQPVRGEARSASVTSTRSRRASTRRISPRRAHPVADPGRPDRPARAAPRLLRRDRRAHGPANCSPRVADARPDWSVVMVGPVVKIADRRSAAAPEHPLSRRQGLRRAARPICAAGTSR